MIPFVRTIAYLFIVTTIFGCKDLLKPVPVVTSPNQKLITSVQVKNGIPFFKIDKDNQTLFELTPIYFIDSKGDTIINNVELGEITAAFNRNSKLMPVGQKRVRADIYNEMSVQFNKVESDESVEKGVFKLWFRMYDDLVSFRFERLELDTKAKARIAFSHSGKATLLSPTELVESGSLVRTEQDFIVQYLTQGTNSFSPVANGSSIIEKTITTIDLTNPMSDWIRFQVQNSLEDLVMSDANFIIQDEIDLLLNEELSWDLKQLNTIPANQTIEFAQLNFAGKKSYLDQSSEQEIRSIPWVHQLSRAILWTPSFTITDTLNSVSKRSNSENELFRLIQEIPFNWGDSRLLVFDEDKSVICIARKFPDAENWIVVYLNGGGESIDMNAISTFLTSNANLEIQQYVDVGADQVNMITVSTTNDWDNKLRWNLDPKQASIFILE